MATHDTGLALAGIGGDGMTTFGTELAIIIGTAVAGGRYFKLAAENCTPGLEGRRDYTGFFSRREHFTDVGWRHREHGVRAYRIGALILIVWELVRLARHWSS